MRVIQAEDIKRFDNWTALIYSEPGKGKTTMVRGLKGRTVLFSVDGMYQVLEGKDNITILVMDPKNPSDDTAEFYKWLLKNLDSIDNIVIDNLSTYQKFWFNAAAKNNKNKTPEQRDYLILDQVLLDLISSLKKLSKNLLIFAHEKKVEITHESGGVYTQSQPDIRNMDAIMGIIPIVGRLVILEDEERIIVLQPTQSTRAKDQLIGNKKTIGQMELIKTMEEK